MISLTLSISGKARWITQHYGINNWKVQPMVIPKCRRCIGIFIFWRSILEDGVVFSVTGIHLPPGTPKYTKLVRDAVSNKLSKDVPEGVPYQIVFCGGTIDTPQNTFLYKNSLRRYVYPLRNKYPNITTMIYEPNEKTFDTTMFLTKDGNIDVRQRSYATT